MRRSKSVCFPSDEKIGPGDRFLVSELAKVRRTTKIAIATKTDLAKPDRIAEHLRRAEPDDDGRRGEGRLDRRRRNGRRLVDALGHLVARCYGAADPRASDEFPAPPSSVALMPQPQKGTTPC